MRRLISILAVLASKAAFAGSLYNAWMTSSPNFGEWQLGTKPTATSTSLSFLDTWQDGYTVPGVDGWKLSGTAWPFVVHNASNTTISDVGSSRFDPYSVTFHPGNQLAITARYVASTSQQYDVAATFTSVHTLQWGLNKRITISKNGSVLDTFLLGEENDSHTSSLTSQFLAAGEALDFSLEGVDTGHVEYYWGTSTKFDISVNPVPEPSSLLVVGLGVLAWRRRRPTK